MPANGNRVVIFRKDQVVMRGELAPYSLKTLASSRTILIWFWIEAAPLIPGRRSVCAVVETNAPGRRSQFWNTLM